MCLKENKSFIEWYISKKKSKSINTTLWLAQSVLAASFVWAAIMKLLQPVEKLAAMWPWAGEVPVALLKFTGIVDLICGLGLVLPVLLRIRPRLTPVAAVGTVILMICAIVFHLVRGEGRLIGVNVFFMALAGFIAWGRFNRDL